jgi:hypothetical protein
MRARLLALGALALGGSACDNGGPHEPSFGVTLRVSTTMTGIDLDSDGYQIFVGRGDGVVTSARFLLDATANFSLAPGSYAVTVADLAPNCATQDPLPFPIEVPASATLGNAATLTVRIICLAATASIEVLVQGTGRDFPFPGFTARLTASGMTRELAAAPNRTTAFSSLAAGSYTVTLGGVPDHCTLEDDAPQHVSVTVGGAQRDVKQVGFAATCQAITGDISITTRVTGVQPDANGYLVEIDGHPALVRVLCGFYCYYYGHGYGDFYIEIPLRLTPNETRLAERIAPGNRSVKLTEVAANCTVAGEHPRTVSVVLGATRETTFDVVCTQP